MATTIGVSSFAPSSSSSSYFCGGNNVTCSSLSLHKMSCKSLAWRRIAIVCSAVQESSSSTTVTTDKVEKEEVPKAVKAKPAKAPVKPLPEMMEEDIIPPLREILEAQNDISEVSLSFQDNKLEGSFEKKGYPYVFWAFFPDGTLTGVRGFSLSSYGSEVSTVEPFLVDEKKITGKQLVFWVEKRLAAQGILPVWTE